MQRDFYKYQGIGNDYIYFDCFDEPLPHPRALARRLSDRHFSVGGDGIVLMERSDRADCRMRIFNADGSEAKMCGNGVRCVGKFLYDVKGVRKSVLTVETKSGVRTLRLAKRRRGGEAAAFTVDMGRARFEPNRIPALFEGKEIVSRPLSVGERTFLVTCVSMGNPHCVLFGEDPDRLELGTIGPAIECHPAFPDRVNVEFATLIARNTLKMRVWERGSGETLACGTGACAVAAAAVRNALCGEGEEISVLLKGGVLHIVYTKETVFMTGPAELSFVGRVEI